MLQSVGFSQENSYPEYGNFWSLRVGYSYFQYPHPTLDRNDAPTTSDANGMFLGISKVDYTLKKASFTYYAGTHLLYGSDLQSVPEAGAFFSFSPSGLLSFDCFLCNLINSIGLSINTYYFQPKIGLNILDMVDIFMGFGIPFNYKKSYRDPVQGFTFGATLQLFRYKFNQYSMFKSDNNSVKEEPYEDEFIKKYGNPQN